MQVLHHTTITACTPGSEAPAGKGLVPTTTSQTSSQLSDFSSVFSRSESRSRRLAVAVKTSARIFSSDVPSYVPWFFTLTYRPGAVWSPKHISSFIDAFKKWCFRKHKINKLKYVWVAELQERRLRRYLCSVRECVHYHVLVYLPKSVRPPKLDLAGFWSYGLTQRVIARAPVRYLTKYVSKFSQLSVLPKFLRLHGSGGFTRLQQQLKRWYSSPRWVRSVFSQSDDPRRCAGGGFYSRESGLFYPSPYVSSFSFGLVSLSFRKNLLDFFTPEQVSSFS